MRSLVTVSPANTEDVVDAVTLALAGTAAVCVTAGEIGVSEADRVLAHPRTRIQRQGL